MTDCSSVVGWWDEIDNKQWKKYNLRSTSNLTFLLIENHFQEYRNGQPFIFPFHILLIPVTYLFRSKRKRCRKLTNLGLQPERQTDRDKLFCTLCDRYSRSQIASRAGSLFRNYDCCQRRETTFAEAVAIQRHKSFMAEARPRASVAGLIRQISGSLTL